MSDDFNGSAPEAPFEPEDAAPFDPEDLPDAPAPFESGDRGHIESDEDRFKRHIADLRKWAKANKRDAKKDFFRYWMLKLPAILSSVITAVSASLGASETFVSILAAIAALCVAIDAVWPGGMLHNVHKRAVHEIGLLIGKILTSLDEIAIAYKDDPKKRTEALVQVLRDLTKERQRIGAYIANAESSLGVRREQAATGA